MTYFSKLDQIGSISELSFNSIIQLRNYCWRQAVESKLAPPFHNQTKRFSALFSMESIVGKSLISGNSIFPKYDVSQVAKPLCYDNIDLLSPARDLLIMKKRGYNLSARGRVDLSSHLRRIFLEELFQREAIYFLYPYVSKSYLRECFGIEMEPEVMTSMIASHKAFRKRHGFPTFEKKKTGSMKVNGERVQYMDILWQMNKPNGVRETYEQTRVGQDRIQNQRGFFKPIFWSFVHFYRVLSD